MSELDPIYHELAARMRRPDSKVLPDLLHSLFSIEQAKIIREMPAPPEEIGKKLGLSQETVDKHIQELFEKGVISHGKKGWNLQARWFVLHDLAGNSAPKYDNNEFFDLMMAMMDESLEILGKRWKDNKDPKLMQVQRVVPDWKVIKDIPGVLPCEDTRIAFKDKKPIVSIHCACKRIDRNRKCKDDIPLDICFVAGEAGERAINRGIGFEISHDEYLKIQDRAYGYGLVHLFPNDSGSPEGLCNCHGCCCGQFLISAYTKPHFNILSYAKSRFVTEVNPDKCATCYTCVNRCPVGAAQVKFYPEYGKVRAYINAEECIGCGLCVLTCKTGARKMKIVRPPEHIPPARKGLDLSTFSEELLSQLADAFIP